MQCSELTAGSACTAAAEEWGGKTPMVAISAKKGQGVDALLETVGAAACSHCCAWSLSAELLVSALSMMPVRRGRTHASGGRSNLATGAPCARLPNTANPQPLPAPLPLHLSCPLLQVLLVAELEELQSNPLRAARGTVLEATLEKNKGPICSLLVQAGTLRVGDAVQAGSSFGKVRGGVGARCWDALRVGTPGRLWRECGVAAGGWQLAALASGSMQPPGLPPSQRQLCFLPV
jgi:hypothetical protein